MNDASMFTKQLMLTIIINGKFYETLLQVLPFNQLQTRAPKYAHQRTDRADSLLGAAEVAVVALQTVEAGGLLGEGVVGARSAGHRGRGA